jgi:MFS family permease
MFPDGAARARALGIYQGATAAGASAGIVLGGILTEYAGWRAIFLVNPPVIIVLVLAVLRLLPDGHPAARPAAGAMAGAGPWVRDNSKKPVRCAWPGAIIA